MARSHGRPNNSPETPRTPPGVAGANRIDKINMKLQNLIHTLIGIVCIGLLPGAQAVVPPPDGDYPRGNTFEVEGAATHKTWADSQHALQFPNASEISAGIETVSSAPPTRSSFMASWDKVAGATGYLLDVSTSDSFSDYVDGYHDLDVGNVTDVSSAPVSRAIWAFCVWTVGPSGTIWLGVFAGATPREG